MWYMCRPIQLDAAGEPVLDAEGNPVPLANSIWTPLAKYKWSLDFAAKTVPDENRDYFWAVQWVTPPPPTGTFTTVDGDDFPTWDGKVLSGPGGL